jgi:flagellar basal-body rod protein FlgG
MIRALYTASTGLAAQQLNIDVIANNLANINTTGFKKGRADFQDLLYQTLRTPGTATSGSTEVPTGIQIGLGSKIVAVEKLFLQGDFAQTLNELDIVIQGQGFFQITKPDGETAYSRAGAFKLDSDGRIVTSDGYVLEPEISIPDDTVNISIGLDGTVSVLQGGDPSAVTEVGNIETARFSNDGGLLNIGQNLYMPSEASGDATTGTPGEDGYGTIGQGFLEMSNVNVAEEMVNMIVSQRAYEMNSKVIQTSDDMLRTAANLKR